MDPTQFPRVSLQAYPPGLTHLARGFASTCSPGAWSVGGWSTG
jgi:hypothetical protein